MTLLDTVPAIAERDAVDGDTFRREVTGGYSPVVLRGQARDWPAVAAARAGTQELARYILQFEGDPVNVMIGPPAIRGRFFYKDDMRGMNFARETVPLRRLIEELLKLVGTDTPPALYAGSAATGKHLPGWAEANPIGLPTSDAAARVWIGNATRVSTHYDMSPNLAVVVGGRRRFLLFPPEQVRNLYVGPVERTIAGQPVSMVDPDAPDLERHPRFEEAMRHARVAVLEPGDAIFMPSLWWHNVQADGAFNVLVNYWWSLNTGASPFHALMHAVMAIRELPEAERAAWSSWFDHYVFSADAPNAVDHLPPAGRGILGGQGPEWRRQIRHYLMGGLAGE